MNYTTMASEEEVVKTAASLKQNGIEPIVVSTKEEALAAIKTLIPAGASVMNGSSRTLEEVGFIDYLKSETHGWNNLHAAIVAEKDQAKQALLRKQALLSDVYLGSVHALAQTGEFIIASNTGSQLPQVVFSSPHLIFVVSTKKIVPTLADAFNRLEEHVLPLENKRMMGVYHVESQISKIVVFKKENPMMGRKVHMILVNEELGF